MGRANNRRNPRATAPAPLRLAMHYACFVFAVCLILSACGSQPTLVSESASPPSSDPSLPRKTTETTTSSTTSSTDQIEPSDDSVPPTDVGVVGQNTIEEFEAGFEFWSSAAEIVLDDQLTLKNGRTDTINDLPITYYNVDPLLFVAATTNESGLITGHAFSFDPSASSYLYFGSVYRLTILPSELLFGPEVEQFINDPGRDRLERTFDEGDVLITRTGVDPINAPIFTLSVIPSTDPMVTHDDVRAAARQAGRKEGSDVTSDESAGSLKRDVEVTTCEFVDGNAHVVGKVTNNGDSAREYLLRLEVFDTSGQREIPFAFGKTLKPGESLDFDETVDIGGGNWEECHLRLLDPQEPTG